MNNKLTIKQSQTWTILIATILVTPLLLYTGVVGITNIFFITIIVGIILLIITFLYIGYNLKIISLDDDFISMGGKIIRISDISDVKIVKEIPLSGIGIAKEYYLYIKDLNGKNLYIEYNFYELNKIIFLLDTLINNSKLNKSITYKILEIKYKIGINENQDDIIKIVKKSTDPIELDKFSEIDDYSIKLFVAINIYTSPETLMKLLNNSHEDIKYYIKKNPNFPKNPKLAK